MTAGMRRTGFIATVVAGLGLLGASLHGITSVDKTLQVAAAPTPQPEWVIEHHDCERHDNRHHGPRV